MKKKPTKLVCAYSGATVTKKQAAINHIVPHRKGEKNDWKNVRWVAKNVNK